MRQNARLEAKPNSERGKQDTKTLLLQLMENPKPYKLGKNQSEVSDKKIPY